MRVRHRQLGDGTLVGWRQLRGSGRRIGDTSGGLSSQGCARVIFDGPKGGYNVPMSELVCADDAVRKSQRESDETGAASRRSTAIPFGEVDWELLDKHQVRERARARAIVRARASVHACTVFVCACA
jgi:hypothetical protein